MPSALLVHHNPHDRAMYADYLQAHGIDVSDATTTDDAIDLVSAADVVITGLRVPGSFNGVELIRRIRAQHGPKPVIVVTEFAEGAAMRDAAQDAGCDAVLSKPCLAEVVLAEVRRLLGATTRNTRGFEAAP